MESSDDPTGWKVSARVHHLAATTLSKIGEMDLAWLAAERAVRAAEASGDPLSLASAARAATHALLANGRYDDALGLGDRAATWLGSVSSRQDREAASLLGMLHLRTAVAAARNHDRTTATDLLNRAHRAATVVGQDANLWHTGFGPTNVAVHRIAVAVDLGDLLFAAERGPGVDTRALPVERRAALLIDVGRAQALLGRDPGALSSLLQAESIAPQLVRHATTVRESVRSMYRRAGHTGASTDLTGLPSDAGPWPDITRGSGTGSYFRGDTVVAGTSVWWLRGGRPEVGKAWSPAARGRPPVAVTLTRPRAVVRART